jgi:hypothetical protein
MHDKVSRDRDFIALDVVERVIQRQTEPSAIRRLVTAT